MDIYAINIIDKLDEELYEKFLSFIDDDKRTRINRFKNNDDKIRTLISDVLIRSIICNKFKIPNEEIEYDYNCYGKPRLKNNKEFHFNISHSSDWVAVVVDNQPVGVDIEKVCSIDFIGIAKRFFKEDEYKWLLAQKDSRKLEGFYKLWTLKESYIKMIGTGLSMPLDAFPILFDMENNISTRSSSDRTRKGYFKTYAIDNSYMLSICSEKDSFTSRIHMMNYDELYENIYSKDLKTEQNSGK